MTTDMKKTQKTNRGIFRVLDLIMESIGWLQIVASPLLIGLFLGAIIYYPNPTTIRFILGLIVATLGLVIGVIWATNQWKGKGTIWFMTRIMATPDLDNINDKNNSEKKDNNSDDISNR